MEIVESSIFEAWAIVLYTKSLLFLLFFCDSSYLVEIITAFW